jgi:hypothetical protein
MLNSIKYWCLYCYTITITIFDTMYSEVEQIGTNVNNVIKGIDEGRRGRRTDTTISCSEISAPLQ